MAEQVKVIIIGGGIVGCAVQFALAKRGWTDSLLLEKGELTSGSTWHAAGNTTHFGHDPAITRLYVSSIDTYLDAQNLTGQDIGFHQTGSLRLATSETELEAYKRLTPLYEAMDVPYWIVDAETVATLNPLVQADGILGAAHTPADGHVDPFSATHALAAASRDMGAMIMRNNPVRQIRMTDTGRWAVHTDDRIFEAEHLVMAASFWSRELLLPLGIDLPIYAMEHHEIVTDEIPLLRKLGREVPAIRDPRAPSNVRQEQFGLLCGIYERHPKPWSVDGIPPSFGQELLPPDIERLEDHMLKVVERMPAFGEVGLKAVNNGPLAFPPDGCPLVGPMTGHPGLWLAAGFPVGIGTGGGAAQYLAEFITRGAPDTFIPAIDPNRFAPGMIKSEALNVMCQTYAAGYSLPERTLQPA